MEKAVVPKQPDSSGEDRLVLVRDGNAVRRAAVVDGATSKSAKTFGEQTGGALAAECVARVLEALPDGVGPSDALQAVTDGLAALRREWSITPDDLLAPSAVAAVFLPEQSRIWRVGDVHVAMRRADGWEHHPADKTIDRVVSGARAALLRCRLAQGASVEELAVDDPGRQMVLPILKDQNVLANSATNDPLGFGVLDGRPVPGRYLEVFDIGQDVLEVVVASDGYLWAAHSLDEAEKALAVSLAADPLRIGEHASTKALAPGARSFDDRTYLRLVRHGS
ncbi:hypothetical protein AB0C52_24250 [Streptomyces sp. NPDC048717]|uniref:hypothetical protein n=1 Tax=Streptomyces sp. NPDC048717 TaxID=3154928 RepID=UPI003443AEDD